MSPRDDQEYMRLAIRLARQGQGRTSPNPMVGAVVVRNGRIVGRGYHRGPGTPHAEVVALRQAGPLARRATLYVNLEPCCTHGRTPPCTGEILRQGLARVVCAHIDPNPRVAGRGLDRLRQAGVEVQVGPLETRARELNEFYCKHITTGLPFVIAKIAQSLDGRIATASGDSRWISSVQARKWVHRLRARVDAVLVGVGTILRDDPSLTVRLVKGPEPIKIILDSHLRTPLKAKVLSTGRSIIATVRGVDGRRLQRYRERGAEVWQLPPDEQGRVPLAGLLRRAGEKGLASILVEGGQQVFTSAIRTKVVDQLVVFIAPCLLGRGKASLGDLGVEKMAQAMAVREIDVRQVGPDLMMTGRL